MLALKALREAQPSGKAVAGSGFKDHFAGLAVAALNGIHNARARFGVNQDSIQQEEDGQAEINLEKRLGSGELEELAILDQSVEAALAQIEEALAQGSVVIVFGLLFVASARLLFAPRGQARARRRRSRKESLHTGGFGQGEDALCYLVHRVIFDQLTAERAIGAADAREEQAQVIVNFGGGGDSGARIASLVLLADGDGRGDAVDHGRHPAFRYAPGTGAHKPKGIRRSGADLRRKSCQRPGKTFRFQTLP